MGTADRGRQEHLPETFRALAGEVEIDSIQRFEKALR